jgi:hypothetical protein
MNLVNLPHPGFFTVFHRVKELFNAKIANYLIFSNKSFNFLDQGVLAGAGSSDL